MEDSDIRSSAPTELSVHEYVEARAQEMLAMASAAKTVVGNNLPLQKLPRHMRRRAASHYVKRLPRKMRSWAEREYVKSGAPTKSKKPSRKHRRRPGNLLNEYSRRKRRNIWLETHIWHAKRFHMTEKWGYRIALHPNDKGSRAAYRATSKHCLLQDISFYACVEISGPVQDLLRGLGHLTNPDTGRTFAAKPYLKGTREGAVLVYCCDKYPYGVLGPVKYMWRYKTEMDDENDTQIGSREQHRQIWIWTHPAMYRDFMEELKKAYRIESAEIGETKSETDAEREKGNKMCVDDQNSVHSLETAEGKKQDGVDNFKLETFSSGSVTITSWKDLLCRFHLTGPLSNQILRESLVISDVEQGNESIIEPLHTQTDIMSGVQDSPLPAEAATWWKKWFTNRKLINIHKKQKDFWQALKAAQSPAEIVPHAIIGLTVRDPRLVLPPNKSMVHHEDSEVCSAINSCEIAEDVSWSPLWNCDMRKNVKDSKQPDFEINALRSRLLVPGSQLPISSTESRIPVLLIQNPGHQGVDGGAPCSIGYGSGWDVIIPSGWSMPFLMNFVYRGARVAGLKESRSTMLEAGQFSYPGCYPDSVAGRDWELDEWRQRKEDYEKKPPAKRISYKKLAVYAPFQFPWYELVKEWNGLLSTESCSSGGHCMESQPGEFYVLRSRTALKKLQIAVDFKFYRKSNFVAAAQTKLSADDVFSEITSLLTDHQCLIPVRIHMIRRGHPEPLARICLPTSEDIAKVQTDRSYCGPLETTRKTNGKPKEKNIPEESGKTLSDSSGVVHSCSRNVIGFVKEGSYSYASGCGFGLGFVAYAALLKLLMNRESNLDACFVLVRNTSSLQYRFAKLSILTYFVQ